MLKRGHLSKKGGRYRYSKLIDVATLLMNAHIASKDPEIGFADPNNTVPALSKRLNRFMLMDPFMIESMIWAANMLNEEGKFLHPKGLTFEEWIKSAWPNAVFDPVYGTLKWKDQIYD